MKRLWALVSCVLALPALALDLTPAGSTRIAEAQSPAGSVRLPREQWRPDIVVPEQSGALRRAVYQVPNPALTTLQLLEPLRARLVEEGYTEVFSCADAACGGFDFRFQLDLLPPPEMFVDLGNYRYILMEAVDATPKTVALVASSSTSFGYVHVTEVFDGIEPAPTSLPQVETDLETLPNDLIAKLVQSSHAVLTDLEFATGSSELGAGPFTSLEVLADWLQREESARVVLVGHTDAVGSLDANLALSRRRAASVQRRLVETLGVPQNQVFFDGAGALSPIASNLTAEGRAQNRRVEVVLLAL